MIDNEGASDSQIFNVTILPVNDPPSLGEIIIPNILEDNPSSISFEIFDEDFLF